MRQHGLKCQSHPLIGSDRSHNTKYTIVLPLSLDRDGRRGAIHTQSSQHCLSSAVRSGVGRS